MMQQMKRFVVGKNRGDMACPKRVGASQHVFLKFSMSMAK
jgi:hypothetical protein